MPSRSKPERQTARAPLVENGALASRPQTPGYSGKPLAAKLGVKDDMRLAVLHAPKEWAEWLGPLPDGAKLVKTLKAPLDLAVIFVTAASKLTDDFSRVAEFIGEKRSIWVAWPKKASGVATDLHEGIVREIGLDAGLVDNKICAVDETWSGLRFVYRLADRGKVAAPRSGKKA